MEQCQSICTNLQNKLSSQVADSQKNVKIFHGESAKFHEDYSEKLKAQNEHYKSTAQVFMIIQ